MRMRFVGVRDEEEEEEEVLDFLDRLDDILGWLSACLSAWCRVGCVGDVI